MYQDIQTFIDEFENVALPLQLNIQITDEDDYAALDVDVAALNSFLFVSGVAEFVYCYTAYLLGDSKGLPYSEDVLAAFDREAQFEMRRGPKSIAQLSDDLNEQFNLRFRNLLRSRRDGVGLAATERVLRVEIVGVTRNTPTKIGLVVKGGKVAALILAIFLGGAELGKVYVEGHCVQEAFNYAKESRELVVQNFGGDLKRAPVKERAYQRVEDTLVRAIGACTHELADFNVRTDEKKNIEITATADSIRKKLNIP